MPIKEGTGLVIGTNLLNIAMPFIKYVQGDYAAISKPKEFDINWRQIERVEGRQNDAFIKRDGELVPAGTILDLTYRWMFDVGINIQEFEIIQTSPTEFKVRVKEPDLLSDLEKRKSSFQHLEELLTRVFGPGITVNV